ncbi:MAG: hypothetical protein A3K19_01725 [Lentisphaerae bacterium RIFOXYB12_FULL_65_16]|nr:MAG: hypothetical protein A3K18_25815 [Lentisphaerae bacterium RIFOXYA12_64_32]OGV92870.1 MAG: hypothetical protein A3K19_01725 [Lentisphaerae bacterium RIFOXYB12_FULL_65_16]
MPLTLPPCARAGFALLALLFLPPAVPAATNGDLILDFALEENEGATAKDSSGNGNDGQILGPTWSKGPFGAALVFDGINDRVDVPHKPCMEELGALTVEVWVAAASQGALAKMVTKGTAAECAFVLSQGPSSAETFFGVRTGEGGFRSAVASQFLPLCEWVHLVGTYDGTAVKLYWNGHEAATSAQKGRLLDNQSPLRVSGYADLSEPFSGAIGRLRLYRRALSPDEVRTSYERDKAVYRDRLALRVRPDFVPPEPEPRDTVVDIGSQVEPFMDDWLIAEMTDVTLKQHSPEHRETVLRFDSPWDGAFSCFGTVVKDGERYRMWYRGQASLSAPPVTCYAESTDGIQWTKPDLGRVEYADPTRPDLAPSKQNNVILKSVYSYSFAPFLDARPEVKAEERYKAIASFPYSITGYAWLSTAEQHLRGSGGLTSLFASPDGIHWTCVQDETMRGYGALTPTFWDAVRGEYRLYWSLSSVRTMTSKDFLLWTLPGTAYYPADSVVQQKYYSSTVTPYFRAPHLFVGLAARVADEQPFLDRSSPLADQNGAVAEPSAHDIVLMTTRDGLNFQRLLEAFLRPGPDIHNWTGHSMFPLVGIVPTGPVLPDGTPTEMSLYFTQHYSLPSAHIVRVPMRPDGLVSLSTPFALGEVTTRLMKFKGTELILNFSTAAAGYLQVEIQDDAGQPIPGRTMDDCPHIYGDELNRSVRWKDGTDLAALADRPVKLHIVMREADLYSIRFR